MASYAGELLLRFGCLSNLLDVAQGLLVASPISLLHKQLSRLLQVAVVVVGTWQLLRDSVNLALDAVPEGISPQAVQTYLAERPGVTQVHDLHIWAMSTTETALTAHLVMPSGYPGDAFLAETCKELHDHFGIEHATLQVETGDRNHPCALAPDHIV